MGVTDGKFVFDGTDDNISCPIVTPTSWTLAARINSDNLSANRRLALYVGDGGSNGFGIASSGNVTGRISVLFGGVAWNDSASSYTAGVDTHIVATWDGTTLTIYKDGSSVLSSTPTAPITPTGQVTVGDDNSTNSAHIGTVDDIRILDRALSAAEVLSLYNNDISDESGNGNDASMNNGVYVGENNDIVFEGGTDNITIPNTSVWGSYAFSAWITRTSTAGFCLVSSSVYYVGLGLDGSASASQNGANYSMYVDGVNIGYNPNRDAVFDAIPVDQRVHVVLNISTTTNWGTVPLYFGSYKTTSFGLVGSMEDVRWFDRSLVEAERLFLGSEVEVEVPNTKGSALSIVPSYDDWGNATLNALDFSGGGNVGTLTNMTASEWIADTDSGGTRALDFDGTNDYVDIVDSSTADSNSPTVTFWFKTAGAGAGYRGVIVKKLAYGIFFNGNELGFYDWTGGSWRGSGSSYTDDIWHHACFVFRNGVSSGTDMYVDGVLLASALNTVSNQNAGLWLGGGDTPGQYANADLDDVYVWDRALSLDEIKALASTRNYFDPSLLVAPVAPVVPPLTTICSETRQLKDTVLNLRASTGVTDQTNYGNDGTYQGGMGVTDEAFLFEGVGDYINVPNVGEFASGESFTSSAWIKVTALPPFASSILVKGYGTAGQVNPWWMLLIDGAGAIGLQTRNAASATSTATGGDVSDGAWHFVTGVYDAVSATLTTYIDAVSVATASGVAAGAYGTNSGDLEIGGTHLDRWWTGSIKDVRIIPRAITVTEIRELFNATARPDIAGTVLHLRPETGLVDQSGTQDPAAYNGGMGVVGRRYVFDGTDDYVRVTAPTAASEITISMHLTPASIGSLVLPYALVPGGNGHQIRIEASGKVGVLFNNISVINGTTILSAGTEYHIAATNNGTTSKLYIDGVEEASGSQTYYVPTGEGIIGAASNGTGFYLNGSIRDFRMFDVAITAAQVLTLYEGVPGYEPALPTRQIADTVLHLQADSGERDLSNHGNYGTFTGTDIAANSTDTEFVFNGTDDYIDCGEVISGTGSFSVSCWVKFDVVTSSYQGIVDQWHSLSGSLLWLSNNNKFRFEIDGYAATYSTTVAVADTWYHVCCVYDGVTRDLYVNGVLEGSVSQTSRVNAALDSLIGDGSRGGGGYLDGELDDIRILDRALSAGEVALQYNKGVRGYRPVGLLGGEVLALNMSRHDVGVLPDTVLQLDGKTGVTDQSPMGNDGTYNGGMGVTDGKFVFDGTDDHISVPETDWTFAGDFTISVRVKFNSYINYQNVISTTTDSNANFGFWVEFGTGRGFTLTSNGSFVLQDNLVSLTALNTGQWYHFLITRVGTAVSGWMDGVQFGSATSSATIGNTVNPLLIGKYAANHSANRVDGEVDDIRIMQTGSTTAQINTLYNNDISDESGNGNHGTLTNGAYVGESDEIVFDGVDDYVNFPDQTLPTGVTDLSVSLWCKADDTAAEYRAFAYNTNDVFISLIVNQGGTANRIQGLVHASGSTAVTTDAYTVTDWIHIAVTATESDRFDLYVNGVLVGSDSSIGTFAVTSGSPTYNNFGASRINTIPFRGSMKDCRVFDRALTAAEVAFLASEAEVEVPNTKGSVLSIVPSYDDWGNATLNAMDFSGNGNVGTLTNMTTGDWVADTSEGGTRALDFDGSDDYALFGAKILDGASTFTLAAWVRPDSFTNNGYIFGNSNSAATESYYMFLRASPAGSIDVQFGDGSTLCGDSTNDGTVVPTGSWSFVAAVVDASNITRYLDGVQVGTIDSHSCSGGVVANGNDYIGNINFNNSGPQASRYFDGDIDDVYVWDRALSLDEIKALASTRNYFDCPIITANLFGDAVKMLMGQTH
jgi:hypothetical protein